MTHTKSRVWDFCAQKSAWIFPSGNIFEGVLYLFENFDDSLEKKVDGLEELIAEVSCEELGMPTNGPLVLFRVIPEWNVDLSGTFRENDCAAAEEPRPVGDKGNLL